jgi:CheY-like chemotaxis protein
MARIGIVEPSADISRLIEHVVVEAGHEAFTVEKPDDVGHGCDVLIAEPASPVALEAARWLRSKRSHVPIVFVSVLPGNVGTVALQPVAHLLKPFTLGDLAQAIDVAAERAATERER